MYIFCCCAVALTKTGYLRQVELILIFVHYVRTSPDDLASFLSLKMSLKNVSAGFSSKLP